MAKKIADDDDSDDIQIISDDSADIFPKKMISTDGQHCPSPTNGSSESDPKKPKLSPNSAVKASAQRSLLVTTMRSGNSSTTSKLKTSSTTTTPSSITSPYDKENSRKNGTKSATALNPPGSEPKKLLKIETTLHSIFKPSNKPLGSSKPEKNYNKVERASAYGAKKQAERDARYGQTPSAKHVDTGNTTYEGFRMANGSKEIIKELKCITPQVVKVCLGLRVMGYCRMMDLYIVAI